MILSVQLWGQSPRDLHRMIILADMGNEPDEEQQIVHLMMYANEFDIEGLIAVTGLFLRPEDPEPYRQTLHPELFHRIIEDYEKVFENLQQHARDWPAPDYLRSIVKSGQTEYGIAGVGPGKSSAGSDHIIECVTRDPRPLHVVVNAGSNTLAQAILDYETSHTKEETAAFISKFRVYENGAQDDAGAWICARYPAIHWIRSNYQTYCYAGPDYHQVKTNDPVDNLLGPYVWEPFEYSAIGQHQWALKHIKGDHGPLGKAWPVRQKPTGRIVFLEGGGTVPWLGLIHRGLSSFDHPHWGGWSGRFTKEKQPYVWSKHESVRLTEEGYDKFAAYTEASDTWTDPDTHVIHRNIYTPVWRWRRAMYNDFACRMDWCVRPYAEANHAPVAAINGDASERIHFLFPAAGETIELDASATADPDGDPLDFNWYVYSEAGSYVPPIDLSRADSAIVTVRVPDDAKGQEIHLILEVSDRNPLAAMYDYRRVVLEVR